MPPGGYHGRYLRVDLDTGEARFLPLPDEVLRRTLGGVGLGVWLLLKEAPPGVDPLAPEAPLVFAFSPLVGTPLTTSAKFALVAKSPLTGRINDALSSSHFALAAKRAGMDALVIVGARREPSVLVIDGDQDVTLLPAGELWGLPAAHAEKRLLEVLRAGHNGRSGFHTAAIGPAGENLVRYASVSNGGRHAGRGGHGAVLGAKRLKAIAVRGRGTVPLHDQKSVTNAAKDLSARSLGPATEKYRELGTVANLVVFNRLAALPTRNFQSGTFEHAGAISGEGLETVGGRTRSSCAACTIGCEHIYGVRDDGGSPKTPLNRGQGETDRPAGVRMEYESLFALGSLCGIGNPETVLKAAALCDELGLDTISTGGTIAFALDCAGQGLLDPRHPPEPLDPPCPEGGPEPARGRSSPVGPGTAEDGHSAGVPHWPAGLHLAFGEGATVLELIRRIARREGIGHLLAEGSRRAAAAIGGDSAGFAPHVKGLEIPGYEPRVLHAMALGLAVGTRGADHNRSSAYEVDFSPDGGRLADAGDTARRAVATEDRAALLDSLILCKFLRGVFTDLFGETASLLTAVTGWNVTPDELHETARRIVVLRKWFNEREGWTPAEDTLPARFLRDSLRDRSGAGATDASLSPERLRGLIEAYNRERGWMPDGHLPDALRQRLALDG